MKIIIIPVKDEKTANDIVTSLGEIAVTNQMSEFKVTVIDLEEVAESKPSKVNTLIQIITDLKKVCNVDPIKYPAVFASNLSAIYYKGKIDRRIIKLIADIKVKTAEFEVLRDNHICFLVDVCKNLLLY